MIVVVQYAHDPPITEDALAAEVAKLSGCLDVYEVATRERLVSLDRATSIAIFDAPDAGRVKIAHGSAGVAFARLWPMTPA